MTPVGMEPAVHISLSDEGDYDGVCYSFCRTSITLTRGKMNMSEDNLNSAKEKEDLSKIFLTISGLLFRC